MNQILVENSKLKLRFTNDCAMVSHASCIEQLVYQLTGMKLINGDPLKIALCRLGFLTENSFLAHLFIRDYARRTSKK